jgi:ferredoxin
MERDIILIDEELCDGCGDCIPNCHEGALQLIDGKARLISDLMCDGLGACIGHCPQGAITMEKREAEAYNETAVIMQMVDKGRNTVLAHLQHLVDHNEVEYVKEGVTWLRNNEEKLDFDLKEVTSIIHNKKVNQEAIKIAAMAPVPDATGCGCQSSQEREIVRKDDFAPTAVVKQQSELKQWPVQFHLVNPAAAYFQGAELLLAADCTAYTVGDFHSKYLKGKSLIIGCPKLDSAQENYVQKLVQLIDVAQVNTIHVLIMEVPCCGGLMSLVDQAVAMANRKVPVKATVVGINGDVLSEDWV